MRLPDPDALTFLGVADELDAFPAEVGTGRLFIEGQGRMKAASTVRRRLYAIRKVHRLLRLPDPTHDEDVNLSLRRVRRRKAVRPKHAKGLTRSYLDRFLECAPAGGRDQAAVLTEGRVC